MKELYFHGSKNDIQGDLRKGTCVTRSKPYALYYARRKQQGACYIYTLLLDPAADLKPHVDAAGTVDNRLVRDTPFFERVLVTPELILEHKAALAAARAELS